MEKKGIRIIYYAYIVWALTAVISFRTDNIILEIINILMGLLILIARLYYRKEWILIDADIINKKYYYFIKFYHYHYKISYNVNGTKYIGLAFDNQDSIDYVKILVLKRNPRFYMDKVSYNLFNVIVIIIFTLFIMWQIINGFG